MWNTQGMGMGIWLPNSLPSPVHLWCISSSWPSAYLCLSFHITAVLSFDQDVMIQEPREWTGGAHCGLPATLRRATALACRGWNRHQQSDNCSSSWNSMGTRKSGSLTSAAVSEYPCWMKQGAGFCEYSLAVSCWFCLQACKACSPLKSVTWLCMTVISGWNRNLSVSICFEGDKYN